MKSVSKKVCLLGDFAVGKTSLTHRFVYNLFSETYMSTLGVKVSRKTLVVPHPQETVELTMMVWDLAGSESFDLFRTSYIRGSVGAVLVCEAGRPETVTHLYEYVAQAQSVSHAIKFVIAVNKQDLFSTPPVNPQLEALADQLSAPIFYTSAKTGEGVEELFRHLGKMVVSSGDTGKR